MNYRAEVKKEGGGGFIITFSEVLSYICNLYNSMNIICGTQLSQNIIYGFRRGAWKCTSEDDSRVAPPRCLLTLYSLWNIKDANVSTKRRRNFKARPEWKWGDVRRRTELQSRDAFQKGASIVDAGWAFLPSAAAERFFLFLFICSETN